MGIRFLVAYASHICQQSREGCLLLVFYNDVRSLVNGVKTNKLEFAIA